MCHYQKILSLYYDTANKLTAIANYEKSNLRDCVLESLEAHGYEVNLVTGKDNYQVKEEVKAATKFVKEHNCQDIFNSEDIPPELADKPLAFDAGWDDRCKLIKALLKRRLPGIEDSQRWNAELIYKLSGYCGNNSKLTIVTEQLPAT